MLKFLCLVVFVAGALAIQSDGEFVQESNSAFDERIIGGGKASVGQFPYHVTVLNRSKYKCGGSIIGRRFILTAAQCVKYIFEEEPIITVVTGARHLSSGGGTHYNVNKIVVHPRYKFYSINYDLAVLHTATDIAFTKLVQPIALPTTDTVVEGKFPVLVSGWGKNG